MVCFVPSLALVNSSRRDAAPSRGHRIDVRSWRHHAAPRSHSLVSCNNARHGGAPNGRAPEPIAQSNHHPRNSVSRSVVQPRHRSKGPIDDNWLPTVASPPSSWSPSRVREYLASLEGWSLPELMRGERFAQSTLNASSVPASSTEQATAASPPGWLADAQWQPTPARLPEPPPSADLDPSERAAIRTRRAVIPDGRRRRPQMGPPFLNEAPQDYPSHLGPVPRAPWFGPQLWRELEVKQRRVLGTACS
jgi:hypothetical protein